MNDDLADRLIRNQNRKRAAIFVLVFIVAPAVSVIIYSKVQAPNSGTKINMPFVYERGLVETDVNYREILTVSTVIAVFLFFECLLSFSNLEF